MSTPPLPTSGDTRLVLAVITGHLTPYRTHLNLRMAREIPELRLATLVTKNQSTMWKAREIPEIGTVLLDKTDRDWPEAPWIPFLLHEREVARATVEWLKRNPVAAIITAGHDEIPVNAAVWWARRNRVPTFLTADSNIHSDRTTTKGIKRAIKRLIMPRFFRRYTGVLPCGSLGRAYFEYYGADPRTFFYAPLEPDYAAIASITEEEVGVARRTYGLDAGRRRIICCNRLIPLKRCDQVIEAFAAIAAERPEWDLVFVGDGPLRGDLEARVPANLKARVQFLGQVSDMRVVGALYRASDVLVLASMHDAWALVVNEAMAAGCAVVCSDVVGASAELVREDVNGFTFPPGDVAALTDRLRRSTASGVADRLKQGSITLLAEWRRVADPIKGVREALRWSGVLKDGEGAGGRSLPSEPCR